jgi:hypothetical protein
MIISRLSGGMGNQMFQYALGRALSIEYNTEFLLDIRHLIDHRKRWWYPRFTNRNYDLDMLHIQARIAHPSKIPWKYRLSGGTFLKDILYIVIRKLFNNPHREKFFHFDPKILTIQGDIYLYGYWQSYRYFEKYADTIKQDFQISVSLDEKINSLGSEIRNCNALCVHVRRGDFVNNPLHGVIDDHYYQQAFQKIAELTTIDRVYVFSDDSAWCEQHVQFPVQTIIVGDEYSGERQIGHFWLMQQCKHFIIPNSTFSWWAAWLADSPDKIVIAPKKWFTDESINSNDITPQDWVRI